MLCIVQHSWRRSLAALTLAVIFGSFGAIVRADPPIAEVAVAAAVQEKERAKSQGEKQADDKAKKTADSLDELRARVKQLEAENAKLREALGWQKGKPAGEAAESSKKSRQKLEDSEAMKIQGFILKRKAPESPDKPHDGDSKKEGPKELEQKPKEMLEKLVQKQKEMEEKLRASAPKIKAVEAYDLPPLTRERMEKLAKDPPKVEGIIKKIDSDGKAVEISIGSEPKKVVIVQSSDELGSVLQELRKEVSRLRDEVAELRRMVKEPERTPKK